MMSAEPAWLGALLLALSGAASLAYWLGLAGPWSPLRPWLKGLAVGALVPYALLAGGPRLLAVALGLSALGDIVLALDGGERPFAGGLVAFLLAHLAYGALFVAMVAVPWLPDEPWRLVAALGALLGLGGTPFLRLRPGLGAMAAPVALYLVVLTGMVAAALAADYAGALVALGALLFAASDAGLAVERFERPVPGSAQAVWASYWLAQWLLLQGVLAG